MNFLNKIIRAFKPKTRYQMEYDYLANSMDLVDLERRQRRIARGEVKF